MQIKTIEEYHKTYAESVENPEAFWHKIAQNFNWHQAYDQVLAGDFKTADAKWFINGKLNITENCIDRHLPQKANDIAYIFEANDMNEPSQHISYQTLHDEVCRLANVLKSFGVKAGDRVCIYMPMIPQATYAMLACARIGAVHSVVFGGFSAQALYERIDDCQAKVVLTCDIAYRGAKQISLKNCVDEAINKFNNKNPVEKVLVYQRNSQKINSSSLPSSSLININEERDFDWQNLIEQQKPICPPTYIDSTDPLFILYTSGSTGKPKGIVHSSGGYMVYTCYSFLNVFQYQTPDIYFCTADVGWITGHSYVVYGPLLAGACTLIFEGVPNYPDASRFWQIIDKHQVNIFYTAPTAIRALEAAGLDFVKPYQLNSLKVLGSVGEPLNQEAWDWYNTNIGKNHCPIVDTWWQTETGGILISALAGITPTKPTFATLPLPGIQTVLVDEQGNILTGEAEGNLCIKFPWPSMLRTTYGDHQRCQQTYFSTYPDLYFTGDGCRRDANGYHRITGRVDDVLNVSGHRIGTAEVENAINAHPLVVESAVVGFAHPIKGQGIYAYCIVPNFDLNFNLNNKTKDILIQEITAQLVKTIGPIAKPDKIQIVTGLPKTRSGKIMRRILRKIAELPALNINIDNNIKDDSESILQTLGDISTLVEPNVVLEIIKGRK